MQIQAVANSVLGDAMSDVGQFNVEYRLSRDRVWGNSDDVVLGTRFHDGTGNNGTSASLTLVSQLPDDMLDGSYYVGVLVDATETVGESNEGNNLRWSTSPDVQVQSPQGEGFDASTPLMYTDSAGVEVLVRLSGPGQGELHTLPDGSHRIVLGGTDTRTTLMVRAMEGQSTTLAGIHVTGDMRGILANNVDLEGDLTIIGTARVVVFNNVSNANITIGAPTASNRWLRFKARHVTDTSLSSQTAIRGIRVAGWTDAGGVADRITAPSIGRIFSAGDFDALTVDSDPGNEPTDLSDTTSPRPTDPPTMDVQAQPRTTQRDLRFVA